ncbi:hypothetical protein N2152v2_005914 [Parachlorella kessleri]
MEPRNVDDKELEFMARYLGEQDPAAVKNHLVADIGCAVGTDVRALRADGIAAEQLLALDVTSDFWNAGLQLFRDADHPPCTAVFGDITSSDFLLSSPAPPVSIPSSGPAFAATRGNGMGHLMGAVQVASCTAVLHVLPEDGVSKLLSKVLLLLRPGGLLLGSAVGAHTPGEWEVAYRPGQRRYLHSVDSLRQLLQRTGYENVEVEVAQRDSEDAMPAGVRERIDAHVGQHPERGARQMLRFSAWRPTTA